MLHFLKSYFFTNWYCHTVNEIQRQEVQGNFFTLQYAHSLLIVGNYEMNTI